VVDDLSDAPDRSRLQRFEIRTAIPLLVLSLAIIPLLIAPVIFELSKTAETMLLAADWTIWGVFVVEYGIRLYLAEAKSKFVRKNKLDLVVILLPFLRPLRVVRSARAMRVLRAARAATFLGRGLNAAREILTRHKLHYAIAFTAVVMLAAGVLVDSLESEVASGNIKSFGDAMWWAAGTVTTVGFGDKFPVTTAGRAVGAALMIMGISLFGFLAGSLVSYFLDDRDKGTTEPNLADIDSRLRRIETLLEVQARPSRVRSQMPGE
jgi:voltage-gated potassium channel